MLIVNDAQRRMAGVASLDERCAFCAKALHTYPLIISDEVKPSVYHAACAVQLATDILTDVFTFFHPPAPYGPLFTLSALCSHAHPQGDSYAVYESQRD
jgi:hypothetical protein